MLWDELRVGDLLLTYQRRWELDNLAPFPRWLWVVKYIKDGKYPKTLNPSPVLEIWIYSSQLNKVSLYSTLYKENVPMDKDVTVIRDGNILKLSPFQTVVDGIPISAKT